MTKVEGKDGLPSPFGRYTLVERLATGGMAEVFKAKISSSHGFEKVLVIKRILPNLTEDKNFVSMFIDEAKLTAQLIHPKIVQVIDFGDVDGQLFIALELIDGFDALALLRAAAHKQLRLPIPISVFITMELLDALDYAHNAKDGEGRPMRLVHRDISPSNVFIARRGDVKLGDFGIAHAQKRESKTQAGTLKGKYGYMSPEQVVGGALDARSDLFAVGVVLAELLTGRRLFTAPNDLDVLLMVRDGNLDRWNKYGRDVPPQLDEIVRKALAKKVMDRYQTAGELREALADLLFQAGFRVSPQDLGRVAADYFDKSPEATERLRAQVEKWEMRLPGGSNAVTSEIALQGSHSRGQSVGATTPPPTTPVGQRFSAVAEGKSEGQGPGAYPTDEPVDVIIDEDVLEAPAPPARRPQGLGAVTPPPVALGTKVSTAVRGGSTNGSSTGPSFAGASSTGTSQVVTSSLAPIATSSASAVGLALAPPPIPYEATPPARRIDPNMMAALDNLLTGSHPVAVVGLDQYEAPVTGMGVPVPSAYPPSNAFSVSGQFAAAPGSGLSPPPAAAPDTAGDLMEMSPMRLLTEMSLARESGLLRFLLAGHVKDVYIVGGAAESVTGSARSERFGDYLVARGILRLGDLESVVAQSARFGGRTAAALVGLGLMSLPDVSRLRSQHVREKVIEIVASVGGRFELYRGVAIAAEGPALGLDTFEMIGAGVLALSPEHLERRFVAELDRHPMAISPARMSPEAFRLGRPPRDLWSRLDGRHSVREWVGQITSHDDLLTFFRAMHLLLEVGLATYV